jgi:hypothetical protein
VRSFLSLTNNFSQLFPDILQFLLTSLEEKMKVLTIGIVTASNDGALVFDNCVNAISSATASYTSVTSRVIDLSRFPTDTAINGFDTPNSERNYGVLTFSDLRDQIVMCDGLIVVAHGAKESEIIFDVMGSNSLDLTLKPCAYIYLADVKGPAAFLKRAMMINLLHMKSVVLVPGGWESCSEEFDDSQHTWDDLSQLVDNVMTVTQSLRPALSHRD